MKSRNVSRGVVSALPAIISETLYVGYERLPRGFYGIKCIAMAIYQRQPLCIFSFWSTVKKGLPFFNNRYTQPKLLLVTEYGSMVLQTVISRKCMRRSGI